MLKDILKHNIFLPGYMDRGFIHTLQPTGSSSGLHQEIGGILHLFRTFFLSLSLSCMLVSCPTRLFQDPKNREIGHAMCYRSSVGGIIAHPIQTM